METNSHNKAIPELSVDSKMLFDRLSKLAIDETVAYDDLTSIIKRDVRKSARGNLQTARRMALSELGIVTEAVATVGIKRLSDSEIVTTRIADIRRIHRTAQRGVKKLGCVDLSKLNQQELSDFNVKASHLGVLSQISTQHSQKKLEAVVAKTQQKLPLAATLEAFAN